MGILAVEFDVAHFLEFKDNKILKINYVTDTPSMNHQIGRAIIGENDESKLKEYLEQLRTMGLLPSVS
ncbi:MAG: hypothetical protein ACXAD7_17835 [Candidatus Kariarchaeaceae archaeon]|jgi:hypothetical protein